MQTNAVAPQTNEKPKRSQKRETIPLAERPFLSLTEFATLFGKQKVWAYRLVYDRKIKVLRPFGGKGDMVVPRSELDRLVKKADYIQ
jgi:hypothetical protein